MHFGAAVTLEREDGRIQHWRIVGEDEADPSRGSISYVAPLARILMNKTIGDQIGLGDLNATVTNIENADC